MQTEQTRPLQEQRNYRATKNKKPKQPKKFETSADDEPGKRADCGGDVTPLEFLDNEVAFRLEEPEMDPEHAYAEYRKHVHVRNRK